MGHNPTKFYVARLLETETRLASEIAPELCTTRSQLNKWQEHMGDTQQLRIGDLAGAWGKLTGSLP